MSERWYNSTAAKYFGTAAVLVGIGVGLESCTRGCGDAVYKINTSKKTLKLQEADLNGNGIPEKFYSINGKVALVEIDGEPIIQKIKTQPAKATNLELKVRE